MKSQGNGLEELPSRMLTRVHTPIRMEQSIRLGALFKNSAEVKTANGQDICSVTAVHKLITNLHLRANG